MSHATPHQALGRLDSIGAVLSLGCAVHCVAMPLLMAAIPLFGATTFGTEFLESAAHGYFDRWMFVITITIATTSLFLGTRVHHNYRTLGLLVLGVALFAIGGFHIHEVSDGIFVGLGGFCLAAAHILNRKLCRDGTECTHHHH